MSRPRPDPVMDEAFEDFCHSGPPPLCYQSAVGLFPSSSSEFEDSSPVYRSLNPGFACASGGVAEEYHEQPVHRSLAHYSSSCLEDEFMAEATPSYRSTQFMAEATPSPCYRSTDFMPEAEPCCRSMRVDTDIGGTMPLPTATTSSPSPSPRTSCCSVTALDLPADLFDLVLRHLPCYPDLFLAMRTSRAWRDAAQVNCRQRQIPVSAQPDELLKCVRNALPGDTLLVESGVHSLSRELTIDKPLRLIGPHDPLPATLCSRAHVLVRTRSACSMVGLTLCRLGDEVGYPNTVVYAELANLSVEACRLTCGGASSVAQALSVFDGEPGAGEPLNVTALDPMDCTDADDRGPDRPQSGVWVGAASRVRLHRCIICRTMGPGIKIYRGQLEASYNTIASASRGANVVANGGKAQLRCNEVRGAVGDGISAWNNAQLSLEHNRIHANYGSGVAVNSAGGQVNITENHIFNNVKAAVLFVTSQQGQATLRDNKLEHHAGGGVQGLLPNSGPLPLPPQRSRAAPPARVISRENSSVEM